MANSRCHVTDTRRRLARRGFTVIELLAAMTVLITVVLFMTRIFRETSTIWSQGAKRVQTTVEGRVIMDFIVRDLTQAIADDVVSFRMNSEAATSEYGVSAYGVDSDELFFIAGVRPPPGVSFRNSHQFAYFVAPMYDENDKPMKHRYRLVRARKTSSMWSSSDNLAKSAYRDKEWWKYPKMDPKYEDNFSNNNDLRPGVETIAENVAGFELWAWGDEGYEDSISNYDSTEQGNRLPLMLDIYLELLSEDEAIRAAELMEANETAAKEFISRSVRRFNGRVFFPNRERALAFNP